MKNSPLGTLPPFGGSVTSPDGYLLALWVHECQRVFSDKMITLEDKAWIDTAIKDLCKTNFTPDLVKQVSAAFCIYTNCISYFFVGSNACYTRIMHFVLCVNTSTQAVCCDYILFG